MVRYIIPYNTILVNYPTKRELLRAVPFSNMLLYTDPDFPEEGLPFLCHRDGLQCILLGVKQGEDVSDESPPGRITFEPDIF